MFCMADDPQNNPEEVGDDHGKEITGEQIFRWRDQPMPGKYISWNGEWKEVTQIKFSFNEDGVWQGPWTRYMDDKYAITNLNAMLRLNNRRNGWDGMEIMDYLISGGEAILVDMGLRRK